VTKSAAGNRHPIAGVVVVNPESGDHTNGNFPSASTLRSPRESAPVQSVAR
jgi:hypothetical protein